MKRLVVLGAWLGAALSLCVTLLMDVLYADALKGTWRDAIAKDFGSLFGSPMTSNSPVVYVGFIVILALMAAVGAVFGVLFSVLIVRFLSFLGSNEDHR